MKLQEYPALSEQVWRGTLPGGLPIAVVSRPGFTRKMAYFVTDFGSVHREFTLDGKACHVPGGIAHYLEHKLFDMPGGRDVTEEFSLLGAMPNAFTSYDMTAYYFSCTEHFYESLRLLLEFVSTPYFTEETVSKEQGIIGQEIGMYQDSPEARSFELLVGAMYENHPIRTPILGTKESIAQITPELLHACHRAFYRQENMLLCVIGDVDPEKVYETALSVLPAAQPVQVECTRTWKENMTCPRLVESTMEVPMPMFSLGFKLEPVEQGEPAVFREAVGELAAEALFGESSDLYPRLYTQGIIDGSFSGGFETVEGAAMLTASGDSLAPETVRQEILQAAARLVEQGIPQEDFLRMKRSALGRRMKDLDSFSSVAFRLCAYYFDKFDYFDFARVYAGVEAKHILDFIRQAVQENRCCMSVIYPKEENNHESQ